MFRLVMPLLLVTSLISCSRGFGNKLTDPEVDVYFEFSEDEETAAALGRYWKQANLTGQSHQSIRLSKDDEFYFVQIIANDPNNARNIPFNELKLLMDLQHDLDSAVFRGEMGCQIVICDKRFEPLININH